MNWIVLILALAFPALSYAANGATCTITPPTTVDAASLVNNVEGACVDVCDPGAQNGAITCGPIWLPVQGADTTSFEIEANSTNCTFDSVDIVSWDTGTAPSSEHMPTLGTLDNDSGCGSAGTSPCLMVVVPYPIFGYVYVHSNSVSVGGASCTSFKVRMKQSRRATNP